jgi:opacity protein-like surface antigen
VLSNLAGTISGFYLNQNELDFYLYLGDDWEIDNTETMATSALDSSLAWTTKTGFLYDLADDWRLGANYEYEDNDLFTDHIYTLSVKYVPK